MSFSLLRPSFVFHSLVPFKASWSQGHGHYRVVAETVSEESPSNEETNYYGGTRKGRWQGNALDFTPSFSGRFDSEVQREYGEIAFRAQRSHRGLDSVWVVFETNVSQIPLEWKSTHNHTQHHNTKIFITFLPSNDKSTKGFPALESNTLLRRDKNCVFAYCSVSCTRPSLATSHFDAWWIENSDHLVMFTVTAPPFVWLHFLPSNIDIGAGPHPSICTYTRIN